MADLFADRHVGTDSVAQLAMLEAIGYDTIDALMDAAVPDAIKLDPDAPSAIPPAGAWSSRSAGSARARRSSPMSPTRRA